MEFENQEGKQLSYPGLRGKWSC